MGSRSTDSQFSSPLSIRQKLVCRPSASATTVARGCSARYSLDTVSNVNARSAIP
ncbi:Uncharacterised protein [Mycobacteroides abscessus subsp. abscessus]|nr:Uncharacterised protein [Mycobacteroides abscessus subsp. abscessus]